MFSAIVDSKCTLISAKLKAPFKEIPKISFRLL
jgi:hypothetical protein